MKTAHIFAAATVLAALSNHAVAETQAERDVRRSGYIAGTSCSIISNGQPMTIRYLAGGIGRIEWQEDDAALEWSIKNDTFCVHVLGGEKSCSNLGAASSPNEEAEFKAEFAKSCM